MNTNTIFKNIFLTDKIYAHKGLKGLESLFMHSEKTLEIYHEIKGDLIEQFSGIFNLDNLIFNELCELAIFMHDFGKGTPYFQKYKMGITSYNVPFYEHLTYHSALSGVLFFNEARKIILNAKHIPNSKKGVYFQVVYLLTLSIFKHHGKLDNVGNRLSLSDSSESNFLNTSSKFLKGLIEFPKEAYSAYVSLFKESTKKYLDLAVNNYTIPFTFKNPEISRDFFIKQSLEEEAFLFTNTFFSLLKKSDILATKNYFSKYVDYPSVYNDLETQKIIDNYKNTSLYHFTNNFTRDSENIDSLTSINDVRNHLAKNVSKELNYLARKSPSYVEENIYFLEGSVGSGKTHIANRIAMTMLYNKKFNVNRIIYSLPYKSISVQVEDYVKTIEPDVAKVDSSSPIVNRQLLSGGIDYSRTVFDNQTLNYKYSIITFVRLFNILFGIDKESALMRLSLRNSLIILDEIQSLDLKLLKSFMSIIDKYSKIYHFKILFMSATLPRISSLIGKEGFELNNNPVSYREHPVFSGRNKLNVENYLTNSVSNQVDMFKHIYTGSGRYLIHNITIKNSEETYKALKNEYPNVYLYNGRTPTEEREKIVQMLKEKDAEGQYVCKDMILVCTNAIEAGVDIDMQKGIFDVSFLDSLEQISGRINRNNSYSKDDSIIYLIKNESARFQSDAKYSKTLGYTKDQMVNFFENKNYDSYFKELVLYSGKMEEAFNQKELLIKFRYKDFSKSMRLITKEEISYYFVSCKESNDLKSEFERLTLKMKEDFLNYDSYFLERKNIILELQKFKKVVSKESLPLFSEECFNISKETTYPYLFFDKVFFNMEEIG